jgi:hypothetical protein
MQKRLKKYLPILLLALCQQSVASNMYQSLATADSLYVRKKYSEAFVEYKQLFDQGKYTPQMLLKMAYVKEGLDEVADALYYLNIYYVNFPQRNILKKMDSLAASKGIEGYEYNDLNYFLYLYYRYKTEVTIGMVGLLFLFFLGIVSNRVLFKRIPVTSPYLFLLMTAFVYVFINYSGRSFYRGIIMTERAIIMEHPSAGANVATVLPKGTRLFVFGEQDIWFKVRYNDKTAYVRKPTVKLALAADNEYKGNLLPSMGWF